MSSDNTSLTMMAGQYQSELMFETQKKDLIVKQAFLTEDNSIVVWLQNSKKMTNDLVHCFLKGKSQWYPLALRSTVKQLNKYQLLVLNHDDGSVDIFRHQSQKWVKEKVRPAQMVLLAFKSELFVFRDGQSFCIIEKYADKVQKISFYIPVQNSYKVEHDITMEYKSVRTLQLNEKSKLGWLQTSSYHVLSILDLKSTSEPLKKISINTTMNIGFEGTPSYQPYQITYLQEVSTDKFLLYCKGTNVFQEHSRFWLVDAQRQGMPNFVRKIGSENNQDLFGFRKYYLRTVGEFVIYQGEQFQHLVDPAQASLKLNEEGSVRLAIRKNKVIHDESTGLHSFEMEVKEGGREVGFRVTWQVSLKEQFMQMLLHIYEDFDDDLLQDAIELLP